MLEGQSTVGSVPIGSFVALGDSFTEGLGDEAPDGALLGWADRLADLMARRSELVPQVAELRPDLVSFCAGGNDVLRLGSSVDHIADRFEEAVVELGTNAKFVLVFTGFDPRDTPVLRRLRGKPTGTDAWSSTSGRRRPSSIPARGAMTDCTCRPKGTAT